MGCAIYRKNSSERMERIRKTKAPHLSYGNYLTDNYTYSLSSPGYLTPSVYLSTVDSHFAELANRFSLNMSDYDFIVCEYAIGVSNHQYNLYVVPEGQSMYTVNDDGYMHFSIATLYSMWGPKDIWTFPYSANQGAQSVVSLDQTTYVTLDFNVQAEKSSFETQMAIFRKDENEFPRINL